MEEKPSHAGRWIVFTLFAVPLLYVLTFPWVDYYRYRHSLPNYRNGFDELVRYSPIVKAYWRPKGWLNQTPLGEWLHHYDEWVWRTLDA